MAQARALSNKTISNMALPYISNASVTEGRPHFINGKNCLTSVRGYLERRPGFKQYLSLTGTFSSIRRLYTWERWNGDIFLFISDVTATASILWKAKIFSGTGGTTDTTAFQVYNDLTTVEPFDVAISNDTFFFCNGKTFWKYKPVGDGVGVVPTTDRSPTGIGNNAASKPTFTTAAGTLDAVTGYRYVYTFGNSIAVHESGPSPISNNTGPLTDLDVTITGASTSDLQVDKIHVYRTTDGGGGIFFELPNSPIAMPAFPATWSIVDTAADENLKSNRAPIASQDVTTPPVPSVNDGAPQTAMGVVWFANRLWAFTNNTLYFSGFEEIDVGVPEEAWPPNNKFVFPQPIRALGATEDILIIFLSTLIFKIEGDSIDTFRRKPLFQRMGVENRAAVSSFGRSVAWLDTGDVVRITDGFNQEELSVDIRPDLQGIEHSKASLTYHTDGKTHWLVLGDGRGPQCDPNTSGEIWVYDLDTRQWLPPWFVAHRIVYSGAVGPGAYGLFVGGDTGTVRIQITTDCVFTDDVNFIGEFYEAYAVTNLQEIAPLDQPERVGFLEYVAIDTNDVEPDFVRQIVDDDPMTGAPTDITANKAAGPPLRSAGAKLKETWYYSRTPACRRVAIQLYWGFTATNFKVFNLGFNYKEVRI